MKKMTLMASGVALLAFAGAAVAGHNNPWAEDGDILLMKNHDTNQLQSAGTSGQDEMRGDMKQSFVGGEEGLNGNGDPGRGSGGTGKGAGGQGGGKGGGQGKGGQGKGGNR